MKFIFVLFQRSLAFSVVDECTFAVSFCSVINNQNSMLFIALDTLLRTIKFQLASEKIFSFFFCLQNRLQFAIDAC